MPPPPASPLLEASAFRSQLLARASELAERPLVTVVAPAGSGKTTLLDRWRRTLPAGVRAVGLDVLPLHEDVATFVADLRDALRRAHAGTRAFGEETSRILASFPGGDDDWRLLHRALLRDWLGVEGETVVFLDNFHNVPTGGGTEQLVSELLRNLPTNLHLVIASRGTLPAAALRLAAAGLALEIGVDDLNLRFDEAAHLLAERGIAPDEALVTTLLGRTEGWATGLQLAARALSRVPLEERLAYAERISRERDLFAYVASEVLAGESEATIRLLECSAVLGRAEPEVLCALADEPGAPQQLEEALDHGLLLGDGHEVWPHGLWQSLLRERLRARLDADAWRDLHGRAARLLADRGRVEEALDAYRESEDWDALAYLLHDVGHEWLERGRFEGVRRWLESLPQAMRESEPHLLEMEGTLLMQADVERATERLEEARRRYAERGDRAGENGAVSTLAYHQLTQWDLAGTRRSLLSSLRLSKLFTDGDARSSAWVGVAGYLSLRRRFGRAVRVAERAQRRPLSPLHRWFNTANLVLMLMLAGRLERARQVLDETLADAAITRRAFAYSSLLLLRAWVLTRLGDLSAARYELETARRAFDEFALVRFKPLGALIGAEVNGLLGDREACERDYEEALRDASKAGGVALEALARGQMAVRWYQWGEHERALAEAARTAEIHERGLADEQIAFPWWYVFSLWILGRLDDPKAAWQRLQPHRAELRSGDLPMASAMAMFAAADLADQAGERRDARALARRGWQSAERAETTLDLSMGPLVLPYAASEALRQDVAAELAFEVLRRHRPDAVVDVLTRLARDRDAAVRLRAIARMAEFGGRALHDALERATRDRNAKVRAAAEEALANLDLRPEKLLRIESLGRFAAYRGEAPVPEGDWRGSTSQRLLFRLLCAEGKPVSRDVLQTDLWPDADEAAGRNNLRVALSRLSDALDPERHSGTPAWYLTSGTSGVSLDLARLASFDVAEFRDAVRRAERLRGEGRMEPALEAYAEAIARYQGPFLSEAPYDEWAMALRRRLEDEFRGVAERYGALLLDGARSDEAIRLAERLLDQDPADERAWALRMRAQLARGDRAAAWRSYEQARDALRAALDLEPGERLRDLAARARGRREP